MDFRDFDKAVRRAARDVRRAARDAEVVAEKVTPAAESVAPAFKVGTLAVVSFFAPPVAPFLAPLPPQLFLPLPISVPLFLFSQPFREGIASHAEKKSAPEAVNALFSHFLTPKPTP